MFDLDLLRSFVSVVDAGGFTRAGERVHKTQSTVSQQIRRLEELAGTRLLVRDGRGVQLTPEGERLIGYARRLLDLAEEARVAVAAPRASEHVRLGLTEDFAIVELTDLVSGFARAWPDARLDVRCDLSVALDAGLSRGDLDLVLLKRDAGGGPAHGVWPERLVWVASEGRDWREADPVPLVAFPQGCRYRDRAIHALEVSGRRWRITYESASLIGIDAAVAGGLGVALVEERFARPNYRRLGPADGFGRVPPTELALLVAPNAGPAVRGLAELIVSFCDRVSLARAA
ncbi:LysR family transcriptional regulator [Kaistia dalseonensis]|uniref:DNA-binding transcriptional LysR family regulator n=1 Tax=Kaistia dalseonensis TaxID=410840 RepID=A0ABU0HBA3_9HYPH|nr:LysR family transcriptional regulator [Kaistia dalseonensis]MCX5496968.1 LysR family transcriptional regulator [Kaistia dalseonensis]MDQ0439594.1 DNA-binding transcriptional LysR family regulator [Kaistia dalseonensis]